MQVKLSAQADHSMTCVVLPRYSMRRGGTVGWYGVSRIVLVLVLCGAVVGMPLSGVPHTAARRNQRTGVRLGDQGSTYTHVADVDQHAASDSPREDHHVQRSNSERGEYTHTADNASGCSDERVVTSLSELSLEDVETVCGVEAAQLEKSKRALRDQVTRLQFRVRAADAEAAQAHADAEASRRELEAARAALVAASEHSARYVACTCFRLGVSLMVCATMFDLQQHAASRRGGGSSGRDLRIVR